MKNLTVVLLSFFFFACSQEPLDVEKAKKVVEELIMQTDAENFEAVQNLYTPAFNESEPMDVKREKLLHLKKVLGNVESVEFLISTDVKEFGQPRKLVLEYRVKHTKITTLEKFSVVQDEGGYKISSHGVQSENI
jgi:hypothetical protein